MIGFEVNTDIELIDPEMTVNTSFVETNKFKEQLLRVLILYYGEK